MQTVYKALAWNGHVKLISAYTYSDAYQQAADWAEGKGGLQSMVED